ncbi:hypothetical protein LOD99_13531 [Oopsacas minuta]|uniref:Uncharacterized protein n=1 Tax=Oopsacas minuta TaxID=111878 RepID=A0AAV7KLF4_9METZ|nr:hypothetical protein LOD99_13531 [Oopsacas minuta]
MKWYRVYPLALITGSVSGYLYHKSKDDAILRRTLLQITAASVAYTTIGFTVTFLIPRFRFGCFYYTLTALITSSNFLFTRQFLIEREWLYRKNISPKHNLYINSAASGAETGLLLEGILAEGTVLSTLKSIGYWSAVALVLQYCFFQMEGWRIRKSLSLHSPELFPESKKTWTERAIEWLEDIILHDWEIDVVNKQNEILDLRIIREVDRVRQAKTILENNHIPCDD